MLKKIYQKVSDILWRRKIKKLQERYGFNDWHLISAVSKPYVKDIVNYIIQNSSSGGGSLWSADVVWVILLETVN